MVRSRRVLKGTGVAVGLFVLFGVVTGLIPNPIYVRMVPRTALDYLYLTTTSVFAGAFVAQRTPTDDSADGRFATGGVVGGFLAFGCPICNVVLLTLFGSSALMTYLEPYRPLLGAVTTVFLAGLLYYRHKQDCATCE
jgi:FtsH-binding integral membrane protein